MDIMFWLNMMMTVVVYQAFNPEIAQYAVQNQHFGGPAYNFNRMSWIKTNFLWMMYRSGWATKKNQEHDSTNVYWTDVFYMFFLMCMSFFAC